MELITQSILIPLALAVASFTGPFTAIGFLVLRKRRSRARRRSPIGIGLMRAPGHTLREQLEEADVDVLTDAYTLGFVPLLAVASYLGISHVQGRAAADRLGVMLLVLVLGYLVGMMVRLWQRAERRDRLRVGYDAELAVGQALDGLMRRGAWVFHDVPADGFNIDHVVVGAEGVFAVETKGYTKPNRNMGRADATVRLGAGALAFPTWTTREPLDQARRQADWLSRWLSSAVGEQVHAQPVLALPGWFVDRREPVDVAVYSGGELSQLLSAPAGPPLSRQQLDRIAHQLQQRCRTVEPRYTQS